MASSAKNKAAVSGPSLIPAGELAGRPPIPLTRPITVAGSRNNCRIHLISRSVSKAHCLIVLTRHTVFVRDLSSREGTLINGEKIVEQDLAEGDILKIGRFEFIFATGGARLKPHREKRPEPAVVRQEGSEAPPVPLENRTQLIGRRGSADIAFVDQTVSTAHAVLVAWEGKRYIRDLGSRTGTFVNGKPVHQQEIHPNDQIRIGTDELVYSVSEEGAGVEVVAAPSESAVARAIPAQEIESVPLSAEDTAAPAEKPRVAPPSGGPVRAASPPVREFDALPPRAASPIRERDAVNLDDTSVGAAAADALSRRGWHRGTDAPEEAAKPVTPFDIPPEEAADVAADESMVGDVHAALNLDNVSPVGEVTTTSSAPVEEIAATVDDAITEPVAPIIEPDTIQPAAEPAEPDPDSDAPLPIDDIVHAETDAAVHDIDLAPEVVDDAQVVDDAAVEAEDLPAAERVDEIFGEVEPTPDSAQSLEAVATPVEVNESATEFAHVQTGPATMSDTLVGRELESLSGSLAGEPVVVDSTSHVDGAASAAPSHVPEVEGEARSGELVESPAEPFVESIDATIAASPEITPESTSTTEPIAPVDEAPIQVTVEPQLAEDDILAALTGDVAKADAPLELNSDVAADLPAESRDLTDGSAGDSTSSPERASPSTLDDEIALSVSPVEETTPVEPESTIDLSPPPAQADVINEVADLAPLLAPAVEPLPAEVAPPPLRANVSDEPIDIAPVAPLITQEEPAVEATLGEIPAVAIPELVAPPIESPKEIPAPPPLVAPAIEPDIAIPSAPPQWHAHDIEPDIAVPSAIIPPLAAPQFSEDLGIPSAHIESFALPPIHDVTPAKVDETAATIDLATVEPSIEQTVSQPIEDATIELPAPPIEAPVIEAPLPNIAVEPAPIADAPIIDEAPIALPDEEIAAKAQAEDVAVSDIDVTVDAAPVVEATQDTVDQSQNTVDIEDIAAEAVAENVDEIPPLKIGPVSNATAANEPLSLDDAIVDVPEVPDQFPGDLIEIAAAESSHDTAFAAIIPPPTDQLTDPLPLEESAPITIEPDLALSAEAPAEPTNEVAPPSEITATIDDDSIEQLLAPTVDETATHPSTEAAQLEEAVAPSSEADVDVAGEAVAQGEQSTPQAAPIPQLDLTPPPMPANAPKLTLPGDDETPVFHVPAVPRKPATVRGPRGARSPFAKTAETISADPFMAQPIEPGTESAEPSHDAISEAAAEAGREQVALPEALSYESIEEQPEPTLSDTRSLRERRAADPLSSRPRPVTPSFAPAPMVFPQQVEEPAIDLHELRRKRLSWIPTLVLLMIALAGGSAAGIWYMFPPSKLFQSVLKFDNFKELSATQQKIIEQQQLSALRTDIVRRNAKIELRNQHPEMSGGFLDNIVAYDKLVQLSGWNEARPGEFIVGYRGTDDGDRHRVFALTQVLYNDKANQDRNDAAVRSRRAIVELQDSVNSNERKLADVKQQLERERVLSENRPKPGQIEQLETAVLAAEKVWTEALAKLKNAQAEEARIDKLLASSRDNPPTAPENDEQLNKLNKELSDLQVEYKALQSRQSEQAAVARQEIDSAMDAFQKQVEDARGKGGDSPELARYIAAAENLQKTTRTLLDELLAGQQKQYERLADLKIRLDEMAARRVAKLRETDPQLKELTDQQELLRRRINAGIGADGAVDPKEIAADRDKLSLVENMIKGREEVLSSDPLDVEAITSLQRIIDEQQTSIAADRKKADEKLEDLQRSFASASPTVSNLPEEQKKVAEQVRDQLASIASARRRYADVLESDRLANEAKMKDVQSRMVAIQGEVDSRKRILSDEFTSKSVASLTKELEAQRIVLADATTAESVARADFENKSRDVRALKDTVEQLKNSDDRMARLIAEREETENLLKSLEENLAFKKSNEAVNQLTVVAPNEAAVTEIGDRDVRPGYIIGSMLAILVLGGAGIWWTVHSANNLQVAAPEPEFTPAPPPQAAAEEKAVDPNGTDEHPAIV